mgnify:CR=1 FL=1
MEKLILTIITSLIPIVSPEIKGAMDQWLNEMAARAAKTPNKFDDLLVEILKAIFTK